MINVNPIFAAILGMLVSALCMVVLVWIHKMNMPDKKWVHYLFKGARGLAFIPLAFYGIFFLDFVVKVLFGDIISLGNISYHLGTLILCGVLGVIVLLGTVFVAPTFKTIISFLVMLGLYIYRYWIDYDILATSEEGYLYEPLLLVIPVLVLVNLIIDSVFFVLKRNPYKLEPLWDISGKFKKKVNIKSIMILWILFSAEVILKMEGLGLFFFLLLP